MLSIRCDTCIKSWENWKKPWNLKKERITTSKPFIDRYN